MLFTKSKFHSLIFRLKIYKTLNKRLYVMTWDEVVNYLVFCHQQFEFSIKDDAKKENYKILDLSEFVTCIGWKIYFTELKKSSERRHLLIIFERDEIEKFKDDIGYSVHGKLISVKDYDQLPTNEVKSILDLIETIKFDSPAHRVETSKIEEVV